MTVENQEKIIEQKERGKNVRILVRFERHGEKTKEGELTEKGYFEAKKKGREKNIPQNGIKGYSSPFRRTSSTLEAEIEGIEEQIKNNKIFKS